MGGMPLTIRNLHFPVANELAWEEGLGVSVFDERVLNHLYHAQSGLQGMGHRVRVQRLTASHY